MRRLKGERNGGDQRRGYGRGRGRGRGRTRITRAPILREHNYIFISLARISSADPKVRSSRLGADLIWRAAASAAYARTSPRDGRLNVHARSCTSRGTPTGNYARVVTYEGEKEIARARDRGTERKRERRKLKKMVLQPHKKNYPDVNEKLAKMDKWLVNAAILFCI